VADRKVRAVQIPDMHVVFHRNKRGQSAARRMFSIFLPLASSSIILSR
jgi:hypothetical protein